MHDFITILTPLLFCLMVGYILSVAQRGLTVLERIEARLTVLQHKQPEKPEFTGDPVDDLIKTGMYVQGPPDKNGVSELIPLNKKRGIV